MPWVQENSDRARSVRSAPAKPGRRALALALAQEAAEARRLSNFEAGLADLEARAVAALQAGREDLAAGAAAAILAFGADRDQARDAHGRFQTEVQVMQQSYLDATRRLATLQRGRALARAGEAARRLRALRQDGRPDAPATLAEAEATLGRLSAPVRPGRRRRSRAGGRGRLRGHHGGRRRGTACRRRLRPEGRAEPRGRHGPA